MRPVGVTADAPGGWLDRTELSQKRPQCKFVHVASRRTGSGWVLVHLVVVVVLTVAFVTLLAMTPPDTGAPIGAGLVALPLLFPLGLPWSLPFLVNPYYFDHTSGPARAVAMWGPAYLNVALHVFWRRRRGSLARRVQA